MKKLASIIIFLFLIPAQTKAQFQKQYSLFEKNIAINIDSAKTHYNLPDSLLVRDSDKVMLDSTQLIRGEEYKLDYINGKIDFIRLIEPGRKVDIYYQFYPLNIKSRYYHREELTYSSKREGQTPLVGLSRQPQKSSQQVSSTLTQNGSIVRGISIGTNQGMKLESGLRMQISGKIADKVEVIAALTDQNTPIQPEGNTQSLQEIDKVFVKLKSDRFQATLGDYYFSLEGTEFSPYNRKLQGVMGTAEFGSSQFTLSGAVSKGKFTTNKFMGQEGNQGPYQLKGDRGQIDIIVLAGTEQVWIDGDLMTRGEDNDYVIEYSNGQITFTRNRLITADSRITIDFQYSDQVFQRSLYSADVQSRAFNDKLKIGVRMLREADNKDSPLDFTLSDDNRERLELAGDNADSAFFSGVNYVGANKGRYVRVDSAGFNFYRYVGQDSGDYNIAFTYLGPGKGDYKLVSYSRYQFVGQNQGSYQPIILLTPAQRHDLVDVSFSYAPFEGFNVNTELALSRLDQNLYSTKDDNDNNGIATTSYFNFNRKKLSFLGKKIGQINLNGKYRQVQDRFRYIARTEEVEKNRKWDIEDVAIQQEEIFEIGGDYSPVNKMRFSGSWGKNEKGTQFNSRRWQAGTQIGFEKLPQLNYQIESINSRNLSSQRSGDWIRQKGFAKYGIWKMTPTFDYLAEEKKESFADTLDIGFRYYQINPKLQVNPWNKMSFSVGLTKREQEKYANGAFLPESDAITQQVTWSLKDWKDLSLSASYIHRKRTYQDSAAGTKLTDLADFRMDYSPLKRAISTNWHYQLSNTQVAKQEKIYIKVERGQGNYRFDEDLQEYVPDGLTGDYILRVRSTDEFIPVIELRASSTIRFEPSRLWQASRSRTNDLIGWKKWLSSVSTETFVRLEEKTREDDVWSIYRLELSRFRSEETTIFGNQNFRQDIYWNRNRSNFSVRLRYNRSENLNNQYLEGGQSFELSERSAQVRTRLSSKFNMQIDLEDTREKKVYRIAGRSDKNIFNQSVGLNLSYRPQQKIEIALQSKWAHAENRVANPLEVNFLSLSPRVNYSFRGKGRLRTEVEFNRVDVSPENAIVPYEMVSGNKGGKNIRWLASFDYNVSRYIRASVSWNGRYEEYLGRAIYTLRAEMRAYF